jgi:hypothetical protein
MLFTRQTLHNFNINFLINYVYWNKAASYCAMCLQLQYRTGRFFATWCALRAMDWAKIQFTLCSGGKISGTVKWLADKRGDEFHLLLFNHITMQ